METPGYGDYKYSDESEDECQSEGPSRRGEVRAIFNPINDIASKVVI